MDTHRIAEEQIARAGSQDCRRKTRKIAVDWRKHPFPGLATSPSSSYRRLVGSLFEIEDLTAACRLCRTATRRMRDVLYTPSVGEQTIDYRRRRCSGSGIFGKSAAVSERWACALSTTGSGFLSIAGAIGVTGFSALGETGDGTNFCAAFNTSASCTYARA